MRPQLVAAMILTATALVAALVAFFGALGNDWWGE